MKELLIISFLFLVAGRTSGINGINVFTEVYPQYGKPQMNWAKNQTGVYFIEENGQIVYIGHSTYNLYKTITRHFQNWEPTQYRATYTPGAAKYRVKAILTDPTEAANLEARLIKQHKPRDNRNSLEFNWEPIKPQTEEEKELLTTFEETPF